MTRCGSEADRPVPSWRFPSRAGVEVGMYTAFFSVSLFLTRLCLGVITYINARFDMTDKVILAGEAQVYKSPCFTSESRLSDVTNWPCVPTQLQPSTSSTCTTAQSTHWP